MAWNFQEAGKKEWARGIEDDIDAAVELVMQRPEIDAERLCIVGGSYGGFSALASVVRHEAPLPLRGHDQRCDRHSTHVRHQRLR